MARHYISDGIRNRAREFVSLELGPETDLERWQKLYRAKARSASPCLTAACLPPPRTMC
jgi:hypothetical protein